MSTAVNSVAEIGETLATQAIAGADGTSQFITFTIGAEEYGVDIMAVKEIKGWTATTSIPKSPDYVRGVINLRGVIVPIFDLRTRFGMGATEPTKSHVVIIVNIAARVVGLLVDAVSDILTIAQSDIRPVPEMDRRQDEAFLDGLVAIDERMVTLISLAKLFDSAEIDAVPATAEPSGGTTH